MEIIIGREEEKDIFDQLIKSKTAELLAVYGRRRVGKTYLIHSYLEKYIVFEMTGMSRGKLSDQLKQFSISFQKANKLALPIQAPDNWIDAFTALQRHLESRRGTRKQVIFIDEFPWFDTRKSGFLAAFEHFWNTWASRQRHLLVIICGSAASWMVQHIINNRGGLHNRVTQKMQIAPFTLAETELFLKHIGSKLNRHQILQLYMAFGGIPHYLKTAGKDKSAAQAIDKTCFSKNGLLTGEFNNLYRSLFENAENHIKIVRALAGSLKGLTRQEIIDKCHLSTGGRTSVQLEELEQSGFISAATPYDKTLKNTIYRLADEFSIFYLRFMDKHEREGKGSWQEISTEPAYTTWCGIAFETVCMKHMRQIKAGLRIKTGISYSAWRHIPPKNSKDKGAQIDLIIDRKDHILNICEIKFSHAAFTIDKAYAAQLRQKIQVFTEKVKPRKTLFLTMVTSSGLKANDYSDELVQQELTADQLFTA